MNRTVFFFITIAIMIAIAKSSVAEQDVYELTEAGERLTPEKINALERYLVENPQDIDARTKLLGYYHGRQFNYESDRETVAKHVLWLINNAPDSEVLGTPYGEIHLEPKSKDYKRAKQSWLRNVEKTPEDLQVLYNAAEFFKWDDEQLAIATLKKAQALDTENPKWLESIGQIHHGDMYVASGGKRTKAAKLALGYYESALALSAEDKKRFLLINVAQTAFESGKIDKAREYANQMLDQVGSDWHSGDLIHDGNVVLGRIALRSGNTDDAKQHLLTVGETPGSPGLNSFGPDMTLAEELLEAGERNVVLEYFALCSKFWEPETLSRWARDVEAGNIPDFDDPLGHSRFIDDLMDDSQWIGITIMVALIIAMFSVSSIRLFRKRRTGKSSSL